MDTLGKIPADAVVAPPYLVEVFAAFQADVVGELIDTHSAVHDYQSDPLPIGKGSLAMFFFSG